MTKKTFHSKLPKKIKLGFQTFEMEYDDRLIITENVIAQIFPSQNYVRIQRSVKPEIKAKVIFKACFMLITNNANTSLERNDERRLACAVYAVLRDNPQLLKPDKVSGVRICGDGWKVLYDVAHDDTCLGWQDKCELTLHVNDANTSLNKWHTLIHEVFHPVYDHLEFERNERDIDVMAWFLTQLLYQNDMSWLIDEEVSGEAS